MFYKASGKINTNVITRNVVFVVIGIMTMLSSVLDLVVWSPCMLENPRVNFVKNMSFKIISTLFILELHLQMCPGIDDLLHVCQNPAHVQNNFIPDLNGFLLPHHIRMDWQQR